AALGRAYAGGLLHQFGQALLGGGAAGDRVVVAAVGGEDVVVVAQRAAGADRHRLLPGRQVGGPLDQPGQEQVLGGVLGPPDHRHQFVLLQQLGRAAFDPVGGGGHDASPAPPRPASVFRCDCASRSRL